MDNDRSERLRKRRQRSTGQADESSFEASGRPSSEVSEADLAGTSTQGVSIKDTQTGTYMYLPDAQIKRLSRLYNILKAEYEYRYDQEFEKNRHFYPLVVKYGLDSLEEMDASDIRERLTE